MSVLLLLFLPIALFVLLIRPQRQRVNAQRQLVAALAPGDEVLTSGGLIGTIVAVHEAEASLELAPGVVVRVALGAIIARPRPPEPEPAPEPPQNEDA